jgi:transposase
MEGLCAEHLIADKGYDSKAIVEWAEERGMVVVIPPRKNRKVQREYDHYIYKLRHLVENAFLKLKEWRGLATRYCKRSTSFLAFVQIRCLVLWAKIS